MPKAEIGAGDVNIKTGKLDLTLKCSLRAAQTLSRNNGLQGAVQRCVALEFETIHEVIVQGIGKNAKELPALIYDAGLRNLNGPCITFLTNLANGGKPPKDEEDEGPLEDGDGVKTD